MRVVGMPNPEGGGPSRQHLSSNVAWLGIVSLLTAMSSAMVYGLLPVFLVKVLGASAAVLGAIEGTAEAATSFMKVFSGPLSDWFGRRKPLVVLGYALSAINKMFFPLAEAVHTVLAARVIDRIGKGIRDAPRDAFLADVTPWHMRGSGFGLRLAFATIGYVLGPLAAIALMTMSGDNFRLVFWVAVIPAFVSVGVLLLVVKEGPVCHSDGERRRVIQRRDLTQFASLFWWSIAIASLFALARFSQAFLVLKIFDVGIDAAFVPIIIALTHLVYSATAYPFGVLADRFDRRILLACGALVLVCADIVLAAAGNVWISVLGAALWGLQSGMTQGLLAALVADAAPDRLRGTAFGIYDLAVGTATFMASVAAGLLWTIGGAAPTFAAGACIAAVAGCMLVLRPIPKALE